MLEIENVTISKVLNTVFLEHPKGASGKTDNRKFHGLSFCAEGHITFKSAKKTLELVPGSVILLPLDSEYQWECHKSGLYPQINFLCNDTLTNDIELFNLGGYSFFDGKLHDLQNALLASSTAKIMSLFYDILEEIGKRSKPGNNTISKTLDYILENYSDPTLSNKDLAEKSNISEVYFRKLFKDCFGTTPKQYILDLRIKMACKMLLENRYSISEISEKCGFSSVYHFCRAFKSITELTPGEYSKSYNSLKKYI